jgi:hypothetical protein
MSKTFKKGDTVRCLHHCGEQFTKDKLYTVREDYDDDVWGLIRVEQDDRGLPNGWSVSNFVRAESRKYVVLCNHAYTTYSNREEAAATAKQLAEKFVDCKYAVYEHVTSFIADRPVAREV